MRPVSLMIASMALAGGVGIDIILEFFDPPWLEHAVWAHFPMYGWGLLWLFMSFAFPRFAFWALLAGGFPLVVWALFLAMFLDVILLLPALLYCLAVAVAPLEAPADLREAVS